MSRLIFIAALVALVSACSSTYVGPAADSSRAPRTGSMGAPGTMGSGNSMGDYGGGPN